MKLLLENWRKYLNEASKMGAINLKKTKESASEEWLEILNRFPEELQREIVDERPKGDQQDIEELQGWQLAKSAPYDIPLSTLIQNESNKEAVQKTPEDVVKTINEKWGLDIKPGKVYDANPGRYFEYAKKFKGETGAPSIMVNGEIIWGVGRFIAALLRSDKTLRVWEVIDR